MRNYYNKDVDKDVAKDVNKNVDLGRFGMMMFAQLVVGLVIIWPSEAEAAPKDTLPPGFHSKPLSQPRLEPSPDDPKSGQPPLEAIQPAPDAQAPALFLPLIEKNLLLPPKTGLLYGRAGLGEDIWLEGETEALITLLTSWRARLWSRPVAELARRLLLTHASAPSDIDPFDFMKLRLAKIYQMGDVRSLEKFFINFPVLALDRNFSWLHEQKAFAQGLRSGRAASAACALWKANRQRPPPPEDEVRAPLEPVEQQIAALCLGVSGQPGRGLSLAESLSDSGRAPRQFFPLLTTALASSKRGRRDNAARLSAPREINAVMWSLYKITKKQPRYLYFDQVEPVLLPLMARDESLPYNWRLAAAQRAMLHGLMPPRSLQNFYRAADGRESSAVRRPPARRGEIARSSNADRAQVQKISNILATAPNRTAYIASLHSWARDIAFLSLRSGYRRLDGLRASLLLNDRARMQVWLGSVGDPQQPVAMRAILAALRGAKRASHRGIAPEAIAQWQQRTDMIVKVIGREFFNIEASGIPALDDTKEGEALIEAVEKKARAEVILRVLVGMDNAALGRSPSFLRATIRALNAIGLKNEAWRIAVDVFLIEAWGP